ncbi:hypothetical protein ACRQ5Q_11725 [Bradyrhizobium sp. PMVTL-01]
MLESGGSVLSDASTELRSRYDIKALYFGGSPRTDVAETPLIHAVATL